MFDAIDISISSWRRFNVRRSSAVAVSLLLALPLLAESANAQDATVPQAGTTPAEQASPAAGAATSSEVNGIARVYGPPAPRVDHGRLPEISWPARPPMVPPALEKAIQIATRDYPTATGARDSLRAAAADVRSAKWQSFPSVGFNYAYGAPNTIANSNLTPQPQLTIQMPIWAGGQISATIHKARALADVASEQYVETVQTLALNTAKTYFQIVQAARHEQLLSESLEAHHRMVDTMERRAAQEVSPLVDLDLARSRTAQIEEQYSLARSQHQTAIRVLAELVGDPNYHLGPIPIFDSAQQIPNIDKLQDEAKVHDPTLRRLLGQADVARADLAVTRASLWPRILGQYTYDNFYHSQIGVVAQFQSGAGLSQLSQRESASLKVGAANEQVRQQEQALSRQISTDIINYDDARSRASISVTAKETAEQVSESYMRQFISGHRTWLDVMNALREYVTAQLDQVDAEVAAMDSAVQLELLSGRWQPNFEYGAH